MHTLLVNTVEVGSMTLMQSGCYAAFDSSNTKEPVVAQNCSSNPHSSGLIMMSETDQSLGSQPKNMVPIVCPQYAIVIRELQDCQSSEGWKTEAS